MLFPEEDAPVLKSWIVKRLETPSRTDSDVDADVLADYVLALLRHDGDTSSVQELCVKELYDFLKDEAGPFVNDVFRALTYKSYRPGARPPPPPPPPQPQPARKPNSTTTNPPLPTAAGAGLSYTTGHAAPPPPGVFGYGAPPVLAAGQNNNGDSRKRAFHNAALYADDADADADAADAGHGQPGPPNGRSAKQARRGGSSFKAGRGGAYGVSSTDSLLPEGGVPGYPAGAGAFGAPPPEEIMRLQQQLGLSAPMYGGGLAPPVAAGMQAPKSSSARMKRRCRNVDKKGFCTKPNCPFDHSAYTSLLPPGIGAGTGADSFMQFQQAGLFPGFPPMMPVQYLSPPPPGGHMPSTKRPRRGERSHLSTEGPVSDQTKSTIVVEGIPADFLTHEAVEQFFSQFGHIESIQVEVPRSLAIVKFATWAEANAAYQSPKVIFDNRFVKVFWLKEDDDNAAAAEAKEGAEPEFDMDEFHKKQEEAQRVYEEKMRKKQKLDKQRAELGERIKDLLAKQAKERQKLVTLMAMAAAKKAKRQQGGGKGGSGGGGGSSSNADSEGESALTQTDLIRAQLAALEEEARMLGLDPDAILGGGGGSDSGADAGADNMSDGYRAPPAWSARGGGYAAAARGRGGFNRGRGGSSFAGRGRNASVYAAYSLDNRPRRVAVAGVDFTAPDKNEALRQYLLGIGDFVAIDTTDDAATVTFADRRTAEQFYYNLPRAHKGAGDNSKPPQKVQQQQQCMIPGIDTPVKIRWIANTAGMATGGGGGGGGGGDPQSGHNDSNGNNINGNGNGNGHGNGTSSGNGSFMINTMDDEDDESDDNASNHGHGHGHGHGYQDREDGEIDDGDDRREQNMDFDVAGDEGGWDIA